MANFAPHMGDPHGDPQTSPQHADPHGLGALKQKKPYKKSMWIGVLWAGLRVAMWIAHVGGKVRHGLLEKSLKMVYTAGPERRVRIMEASLVSLLVYERHASLRACVLFFTPLGGRKTAQEKKTNSWERRFPGTFRTNVPLILPIFSVFSVGEEKKFPGALFLGTFFLILGGFSPSDPRGF